MAGTGLRPDAAPAAFEVTQHSADERCIAGLTVRIDRLICVGFETCADEQPDLFEMDDEGIAIFAATAEGVSRGNVIDACRVCPVDALTVIDEEGAQLVP